MAISALETEELYATYRRTVFGLCRALLRDAAEAEDATQQAFLSAHRALLNGSQPREPAAWLATIARNECWHRMQSREPEPLPPSALDETASLLPDPLAEAIRHADLAALWRAIAELPRQQREALLLREFAGLSYAELGAALAVSSSAVEALLFRARRRLRVSLAALSGPSWLEPALRLIAGGSAPIATKAIALGLGATALTGAAVITPRNFDHRPPPLRQPPPALQEPRPARAVRVLAAVPAAVVRAPVADEQPVRESTDERVTEPSHDAGGDGGDASGD